MEQQVLEQPTNTSGAAHQVTGRKVLLASVAGVTIGGPLVCMMGISFVLTMTLLLITSPLLIIFSPLLLFAGFLFAAVLAGFAAAAAMALVGLSTLVRILKSYSNSGREIFGVDFGGVRDIVIESSENMKDIKGRNGVGICSRVHRIQRRTN